MTGKKPPQLGPEEKQAAVYVARLKKRHEGTVVTESAPKCRLQGTPGPIPHALRRCDGADVVKKNAPRKKKYLFSFPGSLVLPPGGRVGTLSGLDTPTPALDVLYGEGRLRLRGSLVFPRNAILTLKGSTGRDRPVRVTDTFETLIVFSEWVWLGLEADNPGNVAKPLPVSMRGDPTLNLWRDKAGGSGSGSRKAARTPPAADSPESDDSVFDSEKDDDEMIDDADMGIRGAKLRQARRERIDPKRTKRPRASKFLVDDDEVDDDDGDDEDGNDDSGPKSGTPPVTKSFEADAVQDLTGDGGDDDDDDGPAVQRMSRPRRTSAGARLAQETNDSDDSDDVNNLDDADSGGGGASDGGDDEDFTID
jgi:hypothetical protein